MKIDDNLNLVIPVEGPTGTSYVHAAPISRDVFERNYLLISKTFAGIFREGLGMAAGPRVAAMLMRDVAKEFNGVGEDGQPLVDGPGTDQCAALMAEIRRLANVLVPTTEGYALVPLQEAIDKRALDPDDASEVENALVFFTVASAMMKRGEKVPFINGAARIWGAQTSSLNSTAFAASLRTSTETASSGARVAESLVPS